MAKVSKSDADVFRKTGGHEYYDDDARMRELGLDQDPMSPASNGFVVGVDSDGHFSKKPE